MQIRTIIFTLVLFITCGVASVASANCLTDIFRSTISAAECRQQLQQEVDQQRARSQAQERATEQHYYRMNYVACGDPRTGAMCSYPNGTPAGREGQWDAGYFWGGYRYDYFADGLYGGRWYRRGYNQRYEYIYRYGENGIDMTDPPDPPTNVFVRDDRVWRCSPYERLWKCAVEKTKKDDIFVRKSPRGYPVVVNPPG